MQEPISIDGLTIEIDSLSWPPAALIALCAGTFELAERRACKKMLQSGDKVVEFGTSTGLVSMVAARIAGAANVTTFEANPKMVEIARRSADANGLAIDTRHTAVVGSDDKLTKFYRSAQFARSSTIALSETEEIEVPARRAADILSDIRPNFLIIDIEGGEAALAGQLAESCASTIIMEVHPHVLGIDGCAAVGNTLSGGGFGLADEISDGQVMCFRRGAGPDFQHSASYKMLCATMPGEIDFRLSLAREAMKISANSVPLINRTTRLLIEAQRFEEALDLARLSSEMEPLNYEGYVFQARSLRRLKRQAEALEAIQGGLKVAADMDVTLEEACDTYSANGDRERALEIATALTQKNPYSTAGWSRRTRLALMLKLQTEAAESISTALNLKPKDATLLALQEKVLERFGG